MMALLRRSRLHFFSPLFFVFAAAGLQLHKPGVVGDLHDDGPAQQVAGEAEDKAELPRQGFLAGLRGQQQRPQDGVLVQDTRIDPDADENKLSASSSSQQFLEVDTASTAARGHAAAGATTEASSASAQDTRRDEGSDGGDEGKEHNGKNDDHPHKFWHLGRAPLICLCLAAVAGCFLLAYLLYRRHADRQRRIANVLQRNLLKDKTKSAKKAKQDAKQLSTLKSRKDQEQELKKIRKKLQVASAKDLSKDKDAVADVLVANGFSEECAKHMADQVGQQGETTPSQTTEESEETAGSEGRPSGRTSRKGKKPKAKKRLSVVGTEKDRELAEKLSGQIEKATTLQTTFTKANTGEKMKSKSAAFPEEHHAADGMPPVDLVQKFLAEKMEMKFDEDEHPTTAGGLTPPGTDRGSLDSEDLLAGPSSASAARRTTQHPPAGVVVTQTTSTTNSPAGTPRASTSTSAKNKKRSLSPLDQAASQVLGLFDDQGELVLNDGEVEACLVHTGISKQGAPKLAGAIRNIINSNKRLILTKKQVLEDNGDLLEGLPAADRKNLEMQMADTKPDAAYLQEWFHRDAVGGQLSRVGRSMQRTPKKDPEEWLGQMLDDAEHRERVTRALAENLMEGPLKVGAAAAEEMARAAVEFFCRTAWGVFRGLDPKQVKAGSRVVKGSVEKQVKVCDEEEAENGEDTFSQKNAEKKKLLVKLLRLDNSTNLFTKIAAKVQEFVEEGNRTEDTMGEALRKVVRDCIKEYVMGMGGESGAAGAVKQSAAARECLAEIAQEIEEAFCVSAPKGGETVGSFLENPANFRVYEPDDAIVDAAARSMIFQKMATLKKAKEKSETIDLFAEPGGGSSKGAKVSASVGQKSFFTVPGAAPPSTGTTGSASTTGGDGKMQSTWVKESRASRKSGKAEAPAPGASAGDTNTTMRI